MCTRKLMTGLLPIALLTVAGFTGCNGLRCRCHRTSPTACDCTSDCIAAYGPSEYEPTHQYTRPSPGPAIPEKQLRKATPGPATKRAPTPPPASESRRDRVPRTTAGYSNHYENSDVYSEQKSNAGRMIRRDLISEPVETQHKLVPRATRQPNLFQRLGSGFRNIFSTSRGRQANYRASHPPWRQQPGGPAVYGSAAGQGRIPLPRVNTQQASYDDERSVAAAAASERYNPVSLGQPQTQAKAAATSVWGTHRPRQSYPSAERPPLMDVARPESQIEMWPFHVSKPTG